LIKNTEYGCKESLVDDDFVVLARVDDGLEVAVVAGYGDGRKKFCRS